MGRSYSRSSVGVLLAACATSSALAAGGSPEDPRLRQSVSLSSPAAPLARVIDALQAQSGVKLEAAEPSLAGHRLVVSVEDRTLAEVMAAIARFAGTAPGVSFWERRPSGTAVSYLLHEGRGSKAARDRLFEQRARSTKARVLEALALDALPDEKLERYRSRHPRLAGGRSSYKVAYRLARTLSPGQLDRAVSPGGLTIPFPELDPEEQGIVRSVVSRIRFTRAKHTPAGDVITSYDGSRDFGTATVEVGLQGSPERPGLKVFIQPDPRMRLGCPNIIEPPVPPTEEQPEWLKAALERSSSKEEGQRLRALGPRPPADPTLCERVTVRRETKMPEGEQNAGSMRVTSPADAVLAIAKQRGIPLIADFDPGFEDYFRRLGFKTLKEDLVDLPAWEALDTVAEVWNLHGEKKTGWLRIRSPRAPYAMAGELDLSPPWEPARPER